MGVNTKGGPNEIGNSVNGPPFREAGIDLPPCDGFQFDPKVHDTNDQFFERRRVEQSTLRKDFGHVGQGNALFVVPRDFGFHAGCNVQCSLDVGCHDAGQIQVNGTGVVVGTGLQCL